MKLTQTLRAAGAIVTLSAALLVTVRGESPKPAPPAGPNLGGAERYLTFVSTDKPIYRPGEKLYVRAALLHANKHTPSADPQVQMLEVTGPKGDTVASGMLNPQDGVTAFAWEIPAGTPGGEYTVKVSHPYTGHAPGVRKFDVRAYRAPRLKSQIVFVRDGYGPGDTVQASVHVDRAEGGVPANAKVTAIARVDGAEIARGETRVDGAGNVSTKFALPPTIARGEGSLAFVIEDGGVLETASKTIPILLQTVDLSIYPEGGDLVAGVPNRVYLEAFTPARKPADLAGVIVDGKGADVASFATAHEGRGRFSFTPKAGETYTLRIDKPSGIKTTYPLPAAKDGRVTLAAVDDVTPAGQPVRLQLSAMIGGAYKVTLAQRDAEIASRIVEVPLADAPSPVRIPVELQPGPTADGVLIATVWDGTTGAPLAERLVFRKPAKPIKIEIKADKPTYTPGETAKVTMTTTDAASGKPVAAVVGLTVTDDSILEMIEKREQAPRLPVMVLLESDVKDLADAHVYLDESNPKAALATDLLLGTQGWRRYALVKPDDFLARHGDAARRVLALRVVTATEMESRTRGWAFGGRADFAPAAAASGPAQPAAEPVRMLAAARGEAVEFKAKADALGNEPFFREAGEKAAAVAAGQADKKQAAAEFAKDLAPAERPAAGAASSGLAADGLRQKLEEAQLRDRDEAPLGLIAAKKPMAQARQDFLLVREYAHTVREGRRPNDRVDFAETLYWHAGVKTDEKTGQATFSFATSDAVTAFRVFADAFSNAGALGTSSTTLKSVQPFYVEAKMPLEVTQGDTIQLPLTLINATASPLQTTQLTPTLPVRFQAPALMPGALNANARVRHLLALTIPDDTGTFDLSFAATADGYADKLTRKLAVKPRGFPIEFARGGLIGPTASVSHEIEIPADVVPNSVKSELALYPTPLANLTQALEALIQSPSGCFEQTSSTTYPLVMAQQYFLSHQGVDPKLIEKSRALLDDGYARLIGFECKTTKGFEWFGADPGHDALSSYGLLEFTDMALVRDVDKSLLARTREFVLQSRDGKGGYQRKTHTLHTWVADPECAAAYNTWALLEAHTDAQDLAKEIAWIKENVAKSNNTYAIALAANVLALAGDDDAAASFMKRLAAKQTEAGLVDGATTSVIGSGGEALQVETTALATLAWMRDPQFAGHVERSMKWLCEVCKGGRFGSTQSTILALRAIVTYDKLRARPKAPGTIQVVVDGKPMGSPVAFDDKSQGAIALQDVSEMMSPGKHTIALKMADGAGMPFSIAVRYNTTKPNSSPDCKLRLATALRDTTINEGALTEAAVTVTNTTDQTLPTPIALIGIPGGLEVRHDQLKELVKSNKIAAYEVLGREVVLYWRALAPNQKVELPISLTATIPGHYTAPASRTYLYYTDEHKTWAAPLTATVTPK